MVSAAPKKRPQAWRAVSGRFLFTTFMVASCVLIRRYHQPGVTKPAPTLVRWLFIMLFSIGAASCGRAEALRRSCQAS